MTSQFAILDRRALRTGTRTIAAMFLFVGAVAIGGSAPAAAATITVTDGSDVVDPRDGVVTLREAVAAAADGDTIDFDAVDTVTLDSTLVIAESLTITDDVGVTISKSTAGPTLSISGGATVALSELSITSGGAGILVAGGSDVDLDTVTVTESSPAISVADSPGTNLTITGSTISDNTGNGVTVANARSVTIFNTDLSDNSGIGLQTRVVTGDVRILNSSFLRNDSSHIDLSGVVGTVTLSENDLLDSSSGGGLTLRPGASALTMTRSTISGNDGTAIQASGVSGAIAVSFTTIDDNGAGADLASDTSILVDESTISNSDGIGGRLTLVRPGPVTVRDTSIETTGPGSAGFDITATDVRLERVTVDDSGASGAVLGVANGRATILDSTIAGSRADGVRIDAPGGRTGRLVLERSTIAGSTAAAMVAAAAVDVSVVNSTISGNGSRSAIQTSAGDLEVRHATITGNGFSGGTTRGVLRSTNGGDISADHSILSGNTQDAVTATSATSTVTNSVVPAGSGLAASNVEADDPRVAALADNGGPTETMSPQPGSPVINAGDPAFQPPPATDQRGADRVIAVIDIGAVEAESGGVPAVVSLAPSRFVDTRAAGDTFDDEFEADGKRSAESEYRVQIAGRGGVPADAKAVVANVTAVAPDAKGFVTVHPCVAQLPTASSLNFTLGVNIANEIVAPLSASGDVCIYTSETTHIVVDVVGYVAADSSTTPVTPSRFLDTRGAGRTIDSRDQGAGRTDAEGQVTLQVTGRGGVPANAVAVIANVTAVNPDGKGFVTVHPCAPQPPNASSLNYVDGVNRANELITSVDDDGNICLFTSTASHLVVDIVGYVPAGTSFDPIGPSRFLDTRAAGSTVDGVAQREGKRSAGTQYELQIAGRPGVSDSAAAVVINVTAVAPEAKGFVTVHPCEPTRPNASSLNYVAAVNGANELIARLDDAGRICLYTDQNTHLLVDVVGSLD